MYCDNFGTTYVRANPTYYFKMKHIKIDLHFMQENVQNGQHHVSHALEKNNDLTNNFFITK